MVRNPFKTRSNVAQARFQKMPIEGAFVRVLTFLYITHVNFYRIK